MDKDGENGLVCVGDGETYVIPVEACETRYGVLVDQYALDILDGGAGEYRGGRGLVRDYRITSEWAGVTATFGRHKFLPWGMNGGQDGSPSSISSPSHDSRCHDSAQGGSRNYVEFLHADGRRVIVGKCARYMLKRGDVVSLHTGTGGGYGPPSRRPREKVLQDLRDGYITPEQAARDYGVTESPHNTP
jgi:N-methylhydantoinase B